MSNRAIRYRLYPNEEQRILTGKTFGCCRKVWDLMLAGIHSHIANRRKDFLHKKSTEIANRYDIICVEDLDLKGIAREYHLGKATYDNGYGEFIGMLEYKRKDRGHYLVRVDRWYPSTQTCSVCGRRKRLRLDERIYSCECGSVMDRDLNGAINIRNEGLRILRESLQPA